MYIDRNPARYAILFGGYAATLPSASPTMTREWCSAFRVCRDGVIAVHPTDRFDTHRQTKGTQLRKSPREREREREREKESDSTLELTRVNSRKELQRQRQSNRRPEKEAKIQRELIGAVTNDLGGESTVTG